MDAKRPAKTVMSLRMSARARYGLELVCRSRGLRTNTEALEYALERLLENPRDGVYLEGRDEYVPLREVLDRTWGEDEIARFLRLAERFPDLLTREERRLWNVINTTEDVLITVPHGDDPEDGFHTEVDEDAVRARWEALRNASPPF